MESKVIIDNELCIAVGDILKKTSIRPEFYNRKFLNIEAETETLFGVYFYSVAICHQTHNLCNPEKNLYGWEYMEDVFVELVQNSPELIDPLYLKEAKEKDIRQKLSICFSYDKNPENCTLDRLDERIKLMKEASIQIVRHFGGYLSVLFERSGCKLFNNGSGMYELLGNFLAYSDPLRKKSSFLLKLLKDAGILTINDPKNMIPIMDYHMQRVLMRFGCVLIKDKILFNDLLNKIPVKSDQILREKCNEAIKVIADVAGCDAWKMNDYFWPLGRSCCNETTLCSDKSCSKVPCTFFQMVDIKSHEFCLFERVCRGKADNAFRKLWQPMVNTHFY
ncbi:MAG: hypothetical protein K8R53_06670 [Bacteroidales bacterium]|nr:hypothetical protein [Bacteroidales bacterium]